jgi:hypothetical protein
MYENIVVTSPHVAYIAEMYEPSFRLPETLMQGFC